MANEKIHLYKGTVTGGGTNGTLCSEGTETSPIDSGLILAGEEGADIKMAVRCDSGFYTTDDVVMTPSGESYLSWALAPRSVGDENIPGTYGTYGDPLTITTVVNATNTIFFVKADTDVIEGPENNISVDFALSTIVAAE